MTALTGTPGPVMMLTQGSSVVWTTHSSRPHWTVTPKGAFDEFAEGALQGERQPTAMPNTCIWPPATDDGSVTLATVLPAARAMGVVVKIIVATA